jgi:hypothetical protein
MQTSRDFGRSVDDLSRHAQFNASSLLEYKLNGQSPIVTTVLCTSFVCTLGGGYYTTISLHTWGWGHYRVSSNAKGFLRMQAHALPPFRLPFASAPHHVIWGLTLVPAATRIIVAYAIADTHDAGPRSCKYRHIG